MKRICVFLLSLVAMQAMAAPRDLIRYVDPIVGTGEYINQFGEHDHGQTIPAVLVPNGMNFWTPQTDATEVKCLAPYNYASPGIQGFRGSHWISGGCTQDYGSVTIMPLLDDLKLQPADRASKLNHKTEMARPDYYRVALFDGAILAEMTATNRTAIFRFTYRKSGTAYLVVQPNSDEGEGTVNIDAARGEVSGSNPVHRIYQGWGEPAGYSGHFVITVQRQIADYGVFSGNKVEKSTTLSHRPDLGAYVSFPVKKGEQIIVKVAQSFTSVSGARKNLEAENPGWDFDAVRSKLTDIWQRQLAKISVESADETALQKFYTAMYHAAFLPHAINDCDGSYPSFAGGKALCHTDGNYYDDYSIWDTYRALHPLLTIIDQKKDGEMIQSLIDKYEQGGWLPIFPCWNSYTSEMIGDHCASIIADAYLKGIRNYDVAKAYEALRKNAFEQPATYQDYVDGKGRRALWSYQKYGYIPLEDSVSEAFHTGEQVSRTLEYAYDDYCLARLAEALGHSDDAKLLYQRSGNWRNVIDPHTGYAQGRHADGSFLTDSNAFRNCTFITEGWPAHYTWYVPHDPAGLMKQMGGRDCYVAKLDSMFTEHRYWHGNEPCHQVAFMYDYAGEAWKAQRQVREIMEAEYRPGASGLSGNDDAGQMSAWYMFAALGFYPVCPASGEYALASPSFKRAVIQLDNGRQFSIVAHGASARNIYVKAMRLNGKPLERSFIKHEDISAGGTLEVWMTPTPPVSH